MLRDLANQKKIDRQTIVNAIESLRAKGWDVNPYTVADEVKIPRTAIYRDAEIMDLIVGGRAQAETPPPSDDLQEKLACLERQHQELLLLVRALQDENDLLKFQKQEAWQLGYDAGIKELKAQLSDTAFGAEPEFAANDAQPEPLELEDNDNPDFNEEQSYIEPAWQQAETVEEPEPDHLELQAQTVEASEPDQLVCQDALRDLLQHRIDREQTAVKEAESTKKAAGSKFVGGNKAASDPPPQSFVMRTVPPDIRKACLILGLRPEELSRQSVHQAWKREITNPGGHPDIGGETEIAIYLNTAKDVLYTFLDAQEPKLAKKFGSKEAKGPSD